MCDFFGLFCKRSIYVKLLWLQFGQRLEAFWATFGSILGNFLAPTSGHTVVGGKDHPTHTHTHTDYHNEDRELEYLDRGLL